MAMCSLHLRPRTGSSFPHHPITSFNRLTRSLSHNMNSRPISTLRPLRQDLYDVIEVPRTASKHQIKSNFYKVRKHRVWPFISSLNHSDIDYVLQLSKMYHPDLNQPSSKETEARFIAVSNAWAILGDDRRRYAEANPVSPRM